MKTRKVTAFVALTLAAALAFTGCGAAQSNTTDTPTITAVEIVSDDSDTAKTVTTVDSVYDLDISDRDDSGDYDAASAVTLDPSGDLTITAAGTYLLTGTYSGTIVVAPPEDAKVQLVLSDATIAVSDGPAIYVQSADKVFLTAADGTTNAISDGSSYTYTDGDTDVDAAVFSKADLTVNGSGKLTITGSAKHAVVSKDDLVITADNLTVTAANVALNGKDSVKIVNATVTATAGSDAIRV